MLILNVAALPAQAHAVSSPLFTGWIIKVRSPEKTHLLSATQKLLFVYNLLTAVRLQLVSDFKPACLPSCVFRHKPAVNIWSGFDELVSRQVYIATSSKYRKILSVIWSHCDLKKKQTKCEQIEKQFSPTQQHIRIQIQERQLNRAMSCIPLRVCWIIYRVLFFCMDFLMSGIFWDLRATEQTVNRSKWTYLTPEHWMYPRDSAIVMLAAIIFYLIFSLFI